jgi:hypothetical protein
MRLLDYDPFTGVTTYFEHDPVNQKNTIKYSQDVEPIFEMNKHDASQFDKKNNWWKVGTIPNNIIMQWSQECGHKPYSREWQEYARKQLNSTDYRKINVNKIRLKK